MSDEQNARPKSMPPPVPQRPRSVPPPEPTIRDAVGDGGPMGARQFRSTTRMTADEIQAVIASNKAAAAAGGEAFDPERTMVLDPDEDGVDESPTVDYDPRAQLPRQRSSRPAGGGPTPIIPPAPRVPALTQPAAAEPPKDALRDTGRKRSSRRTVKIPDDPVERRNLPQVITRAETAPVAPPPQTAEARRAGSTTQPLDPPPVPPAAYPMEGGDTYSDLAETGAHPAALPFNAEPGIVPMQLNDTTDVLEPRIAAAPPDDGVLRPMRIINVGSEPPPPITSAIAEWPSASSVGVYTPYGQQVPPQSAPSSGPGPDSAEAETVRRFVPSATKTDLLPPAIPEEGWTPAPPEVLRAPAVPQFEAAPEAAKAHPVVDVVVEEAPALQITESDEGAQELLEDIEPDAVPIPAKKPPPPPPKGREGKAREAVPETLEIATKKQKPWFEDLFSEDYIKTMDVLPDEHVRREVDFVEESLGVEKQGVILDLACGRGEMAIELASRGYNVVGLDLSPVALALAHENLRVRALEGAMEAKPSFMRSDMRELNFEENFDGAYCWATSFGYFEDDVNLAVLKRLHRALRQGGNLLIDVANRDYIAPRSPSLVWFEGDRCTCMDEMQVDFLTSRLKVKRTAMFEDGHSREVEYSLRLYSLDALGRMLREVGFRVVEVTGLVAHPGIFFGTESPRLIILAERT
ncbi:MAG: methyltransferase domain-containing protein [Polyangiaceae bacterium]